MEMEIDLEMEEDGVNSCSPSPVVVEPAPASSSGSKSKAPKDRLLDLLDKLELRVERLRQQAVDLEEEKDKVLTTLVTLKNSDLLQDLQEEDRENVLQYADRVTSKCLTVEIPLKAERDKCQENALNLVNSMIDALVVQLQEDLSGSRHLCATYLNAFSSLVEQGMTDETFDATIVECSLDDQKKIQKRLLGLLSYIDKNVPASKKRSLD